MHWLSEVTSLTAGVVLVTSVNGNNSPCLAFGDSWQPNWLFVCFPMKKFGGRTLTEEIFREILQVEVVTLEWIETEMRLIGNLR